LIYKLRNGDHPATALKREAESQSWERLQKINILDLGGKVLVIETATPGKRNPAVKSFRAQRDLTAGACGCPLAGGGGRRAAGDPLRANLAAAAQTNQCSIGKSLLPPSRLCTQRQRALSERLC